MFTDYYKNFVDWMTESKRYYTTIQELNKLSDEELKYLNLTRDNLIFEVNKTYMERFANK